MPLLKFILLALLIALCAAAELLVGSVDIGLREALQYLGSEESIMQAKIINQVRLPRMMTAACAGGALAVCGLMMQTVFRNPLAGPSVLGITSGSSLAIAVLAMLGGGALLGLGHVLAAFVGAMIILGLILLADLRTRSSITLLIVGLMVGYLCSALISVIEMQSSAEGIRRFVIWGFGSFDGVTMSDLKSFAPIVLVGLLAAFLMAQAMNGLLLGEEQARALGLNVLMYKRLILLVAGILTALVTAYTGPIAFLGLAVPHVARALFNSSDHRILLPGAALTGIFLGLICDLIRHLPESGMIPLNAVTSMIGAPVVLWILLKGKKWFGAV